MDKHTYICTERQTETYKCFLITTLEPMYFLDTISALDKWYFFQFFRSERQLYLSMLVLMCSYILVKVSNFKWLLSIRYKLSTFLEITFYF